MANDKLGPGYRALDGALAELHGEPRTFWYTPERLVEETDGLFAGIRAYPAEAPVPHWHYVTFGLSELDEKVSTDREVSGHGFELTCRVPRGRKRGAIFRALAGRSPEVEPPRWPFDVVAFLARYVLEKAPFEVGHNFDLQGSMDGKGPLQAVVFAADPLLRPLSTPNGSVEFLQAVGLHPDELTALKEWKADAFLELLRERSPLLLTDPDRSSILADPAFARRVRDGIDRDGSSRVVAMVEEVSWVRTRAGRVELTLGLTAARELRAAIPSLLRRGRPFLCSRTSRAGETTVVFTRAEKSAWLVEEPDAASGAPALVVQLADDALDRVEASLSTEGRPAWPDLAADLPRLTVRIAESRDEPTGPELHVDLDDPMFSWFLLGWELEIRAGYTPMSAIMEELPERFFEHFSEFGPRTAERLLEKLRVRTEAILAREREGEAAWSGPTTNDLLTAAFAALREGGILALENPGISIQDGWGCVGRDQRPGDRGAAFFHQQDVFDALEGEELLVAFGSFEPDPGRNLQESEAIAREVLSALHDHGIDASWGGAAEERICIPAFEWRRRRWTESPDGPRPRVARSLGLKLDSARLLAVPAEFGPERIAKYVQPICAVRSSAGFHAQLATIVRNLWVKHGGVRGQLCHSGPPHVFVRAGEMTSLAPRNAYLNLTPDEARELRLCGLRANPDP
jgi:hypothetical protein